MVAVRFVYWFDLRDWDIHGKEKDANVFKCLRSVCVVVDCCLDFHSLGYIQTCPRRRLIPSKRPQCEPEMEMTSDTQAAIQGIAQQYSRYNNRTTVAVPARESLGIAKFASRKLPSVKWSF